MVEDRGHMRERAVVVTDHVRGSRSWSEPVCAEAGSRPHGAPCLGRGQPAPAQPADPDAADLPVGPTGRGRLFP
jgi:hypothetical protein